VKFAVFNDFSTTEVHSYSMQWLAFPHFLDGL